MENISENFAANLRHYRGDSSMSDFAKFLGLKNQTTYFRYEKGRVPKPEIIAQIAIRLGITTTDLLSAPAEEHRSRAAVRESSQKFSQTDKGRAMGLRLQDLASETSVKSNVKGGPIPLSELGFRRVPLVSWAKAGQGTDFEDLCDQLADYVLTQTPDPNAFGLILEGDSMEPEAMAGDHAVFAPNAEPRNGDLVVARLNSGEVFFKRYYRTGEDGRQVKLVSTNKIYNDILKDRADFRFIYPCVNLVRQYRR